MAYKTCENCGCRIFEYGCVNCNERDYITMQEGYEPPVAKKLHKPDVIKSVCDYCGQKEVVRKDNGLFCSVCSHWNG